MKRLLVLLLILALAGVASATSLNFQNPGDFTQIQSITDTSGGIGWTESGIGGNNYITVTHYVSGVPSPTGTFFILNSPSSTTYAAATYLGGTGTYPRASVVLLDSNKNVIWVTTLNAPSMGGRAEIKIVGGYAKTYYNGVLDATSGALLTNPSYVGFGTYSPFSAGYSSVYWDNYVYGSAENKYVLGLPESDDEMYVILSDITNPSAAGLAFGGNGTVVNSNYMVGTWSRGNSTTPLTNESVQLINYVSGTVYEQTYTGDAFSGSYSFDILTNIINNPSAPMGLYAITIPGSGAYSNQIWYKSNGASVAWSSETYSMQDVGSIITIVAAGDYWDTSTYTYSLGVMDVYGGWHGTNTSITTQTATVTHSWNADTDSPGVYYAVLTATSRSTGVSYILGYDYTTLSSYVNFAGYVHNAETQTVISGANVSMTQDGTACNTLSAADGNYTCSGFSTGAIWYVNATASGFRQYTFNATPLAAKGVPLNITMTPLSPVEIGLAVGGVARDTVYGRPISGATITITNATRSESYVTTANSVGYYLLDETKGVFLTNNGWYQVVGSKLGYSNSTTYSLTVVGA
jgi:hypothetical protein